MTQQLFNPTDLFSIVKAHVASRFHCVLLPDGAIMTRTGDRRVGEVTGYRYVSGELQIDVVMPLALHAVSIEPVI